MFVGGLSDENLRVNDPLTLSSTFFCDDHVSQELWHKRVFLLFNKAQTKILHFSKSKLFYTLNMHAFAFALKYDLERNSGFQKHPSQ